MNYTGTITVKIKPKLLNHTPVGDGFLDITRRISFSEGGADSSFTFTESSDGSLGEAQFTMFTMFPLSITDWSNYSGATVDDKLQTALNDHTFDFEIPPRSEVQIYEDATLIFGGVITEVSRTREGGTITTQVKCSDYTALLDEVVIDRYKAPFEVYDYEIIRGGYQTDPNKNGVSITKVSNGSSGGGSPTRLITVNLNDAHDLIVGQKVDIDRTSNYNGEWTVASIVSIVSYTASSASAYAGPVSVSNAARAGSTATITVGTHAFVVGDIVEVDLETGPTGYEALNGTWTVKAPVTSTTFAYTTTTTGTVTSGAATGTVQIPDEKSGRSTPWTISFFEDVNKTDPYSGASIAHGINYDSPTSTTGYVVTDGSDWRFSPINYVPDAQFPESLGAKIFLPLSEGKSDSGRGSVDPRALDSDQRLRLYHLENEITERYIISSVGAYDATNNYLDVTTISEHNFQSGQFLNFENIDVNRPGDYTAGFRGNRQSSTVLRLETDVDPGISVRSATITAATCDFEYATYTSNNTFKIGDAVGISGITESGVGGSFNVAYGIIEEATATTFKIKNFTFATYTSGGTAYTSTVVLRKPVQSIKAIESRFKMIAAERVAGITTIWYDKNPTFFNIGDVVHINGSTTYDGRFTVTETGSAAGNPGNPARVKRLYRKGNKAWIELGKSASPYASWAAHPFNKGDVVDITLSSEFTNAGSLIGNWGGNEKIITAEGLVSGSAQHARIHYDNTGPNTKYGPIRTTKAQAAASSVTFSTTRYSYIKFVDERADTTTSGRAVPAGSYVSFPLYAWAGVTGGSRYSNALFGSRPTMPNDSLLYIGGRQSVDFESAEYMGMSTAKSASTWKVQRTSNKVTIRTAAPHLFSEGETVTVALSGSPYNAMNGSYEITEVTAGTISFAFSGTDIAEVGVSGTLTSQGLGFYAAGNKMSCICVIKPESLPAASAYRTIWHHGSPSTGQRRELQIDSSGAICFMTINNGASTERFTTTLTLVAGETAIIFVSYNPTTGALVIQKNDEAAQSTTVSTKAATNSGGFAVGFGYGTLGTLTTTSYFDGLIGNIYIIDRVLPEAEREQLIAWMAHYFTISDLLAEDNAYRYLADHPGKIEVNRAKEPFNGMTLRQAMDYICKKTGSQYWVDANKNLHYQRRDVKNVVVNPTFEDKFGNASTTEWTFGGSFALSTRSSGPYGYGYSATATGSTESIASSQYFTVTANQVYFASTMIKTSNTAKSRLKIRFYDASNTQVGAEKTIGSGVNLNNSWQKMWGMVKVPGTAGIVKAALIFHHTSHSSSYTDYYADPNVVQITSEYGFADYGIAPGSSTEMLFDPDLNAILPMKTYESPQNISQSGTQANRLYLYGKATTVDQSNNILTPYVATGQVIRYTFDFVQGVWDTHGKIVESSKTNANVETVEDAVLAASSFWAENGKSIESYEFEHPNNASAGRLTVGSIIPFLWSEVGITEPLVVKSQTVNIIGGEIYYSVQLAGEPAFQKNAIILVQKEYLTENLGTGKVNYMTPTAVSNLVIRSVDQDGKPTTTAQNVELVWLTDKTNPRNKRIVNYDVARRKQQLVKTSFGKSNFVVAAGTVDVRTAAAAGAAATVTLRFNKSTGIDVGTYINVKNGQFGKKSATNPSIAGDFEVTSVSANGKTITYLQYAPATSGIVRIPPKKQTQLPNIVVSWYEDAAATTISTWEVIANPTSTTYTDDGRAKPTETGTGVDIKYRYQYRVRAVAKDLASPTILINGPWTYVPAGYLSTSSNLGWIYITDNLILSGVVEPTEATG
jgi:hypothetical protein